MEIEDITLDNLIILDGDYRIIIMMETKIIRETKIVIIKKEKIVTNTIAFKKG